MEWIEGTTLDKIEFTKTIAYEMGVMIGKMHNNLEHVSIPNAKRYLSNESNRFILVHSDLGKSNLVPQHRKIKGQPWLDSKLDGWCENYFIPLITKD